MIRELQNLKVRALAVEVPESAFDFSYSVAYQSVWYLTHNIGIGVKSVGENWFQTEVLPEGQWKILGRADELNLELCQKMGHRIGSWVEYRKENNITNKLILIEQP